MVYVTRFEEDMDKNQIEENLKSDEPLEIANIDKYEVGNFTIGNGDEGYINGKLSVRRVIKDKNFERTEDYEIEITKKEDTIYDEVGFTVYPDMEIITFSSKKKAKRFGKKTLANILFESETDVKGIEFNPEAVLEAKKDGEFYDVWYNGVENSGKVDYTQQHGTDMDEDGDFMAGDGRSGIGVHYDSKQGRPVKVAVYKTGSIRKLGSLTSWEDELIIRKETIKKFIEYSNYDSPEAEIDTGLADIRDFC